MGDRRQFGRWRRWVTAAGVIGVIGVIGGTAGAEYPAVMAAPERTVAEAQRGDSLEASASADSDGIGALPLPVPRPLRAFPAVADIGKLPATQLVGASMPITAALAVQDLREFAGALDTWIPGGPQRFPVDSLRPLRVARAAAWLARLQSVQGTGVSGRQQLPLAMVAFQAERNSLARHLIDARLRDASRPAERSLTLAAAVELFTDPGQGDVRLTRNLPIALAYASQLAALPAGGYPTRSDSSNVRRRALVSVVTVLRILGAAHDTPALLSYLPRLMMLVQQMHLPIDDRRDLVRWTLPYGAIATAYSQAPNGRARLDTLDAQLLHFARRQDTEWPADIPAADRPRVREREDNDIRDVFRAYAMIGQPAPPVTAHAWLNTADSTYQPTPRTHALNDGIIHVLVFTSRDDRRLAILQQVQQQFTSGVQIVAATQTEGHAGPDLVSPADEVRWLTTFYTKTKGLTFPIALWAGSKVAQEGALPDADSTTPGALTAGHGEAGMQASSHETPVTVVYQRQLPAPSPVPDRYRLAVDRDYCIVVDGQGIVRALHALNDPLSVSAAELLRLLNGLRDDVNVPRVAIPHAVSP